MKGLYEEYSQLSTVKLQGAVVKGEIDEEVSALGERGKGWRISLKGRE